MMSGEHPEAGGTETRPIVVQRKASELRDRAEKADRRRRRFLIGAGAVAVAAILVGFVTALAASRGEADRQPVNMVGGGVTIGQNLQLAGGASASAAPLTVEAYLDFDCAQCAGFIQANGEQLRGWASSGRMVVTIHPVAQSGTQYSIAAAAAAGCVASYAPDSFFSFVSALMVTNADGSLTRDTGRIVQAAAQATGTENAALTSCIEDGAFRGWAARTADSVGSDAPGGSEAPIVAPAVFVNGVRFDGSATDPVEFSTFVVQSEPASTSGAAGS